MTFQASQLQPFLDARAYQRGVAYFKEGRVRLTEIGTSHVRGVVEGSDDYQAQIQWKNSEIRFQCDCPVNMDGDCCKHLVALALTYEQACLPVTASENHEPSSTIPATNAEPLAVFLQQQSPAQLVAWLLDFAKTMPAVEQALSQHRLLSGEIAMSDMKKSLSSLIGRARFLDYRASNHYAAKIRPAVEMVAQLIRIGKVTVALELAEYALLRLFKVLAQADDSAGRIGDSVFNMADLHLQACTALAPLDGTFLKGLNTLFLADDWGMVEPADYFDLMDAEALSTWETQILQLWHTALAQPTLESKTSAEIFRLNRLVEQLATHRGDVGLLIKLHSSDLSNPYQYLKLAEICQKHQRPREALQWAERGHLQYPEHVALNTLLAASYAQDGLEKEAIALHWQNFSILRSAQAYAILHEKTGADWPHWREKAMQLLIEKEQNHQRSNVRFNRTLPPNATERFLCLNVEADWHPPALDEALYLARAGLVRPTALLDFCHKIKLSHPQDAIFLLQTLIPPLLVHVNNQSYQQVVHLVETLHGLMPTADFCLFLETLRRTYKAKRNLMQQLSRF